MYVRRRFSSLCNFSTSSEKQDSWRSWWPPYTTASEVEERQQQHLIHRDVRPRESVCDQLQEKKKSNLLRVKIGESRFYCGLEVGEQSVSAEPDTVLEALTGWLTGPALFVCTAGSNVASCSPGD